MLRFKSTSDFQKEVRKRVRLYLKEEGKSGLADYRYYLKAVLNLAMYLVPFILFLTGYSSFLTTTLLWAITGLGMAGVGMNVMHDAIHNTVTRSEWVNRKIGAVIYMLAGNSYTWRVQHNIKHHTHTNIDGHDDDIETGKSILKILGYGKESNQVDRVLANAHINPECEFITKTSYLAG